LVNLRNPMGQSYVLRKIRSAERVSMRASFVC